jgi:exopolyphosphatase/guanosine-5'-triphosphate,3'-diphosphate pyrophosphatase
MQHAEHVKKISLQLFHDLESLHKIDANRGELLEAAALLHDVGYLISHDQHHKHSYYIISQCMMPGFTNDEAEVIANIARYHRKSHPKKKHENFLHLTTEKKNIINLMAGILRIAEGIDRRQLQVITNIKATFINNLITIVLSPDSSKPIPDIELWGANRRKLLLEETLKMKIDFQLDNK